MMNDIVLQKFDFNSKARRFVPIKNDRRFTSNKKKSRKNSFEIRPLISADSDSCSEDEITLHDIRHIKNLQDGTHENHNLRKINKNDCTEKNGSVSASSKVADLFSNCEFLNLKIEDGDTLQSISIKYHCTISDIKRANNLINNQEFYALKHLKIPVKKYSLLTEILPPLPDAKQNSTIVEEPENNIRVINIGIGHVGRSPSPEETATFFKRMDEDLVKIMLSTQTQKESLEAAAVALTTPQIQPLVKDPYNTVDCGIQWNYLLIFVIVLAIFVPAVVTVYMYMRSSHAHHQDVYPSSSSNETYNSVAKEVIAGIPPLVRHVTVKVTETTIANCFLKAGFTNKIDSIGFIEENVPNAWDNNMSLTFEEYINSDKNAEIYWELADQDILPEVLNKTSAYHIETRV